MNPKITVADIAVFLNQTVQNVHHLVKSKKIPYQKSANRIYLDHDGARELLKLKFPEIKIIAIDVVKGGPGKTSTTKNLGIRASLYGARVLLIDLDQQGNLTGDLMTSADQSPVIIDLIVDPNIPIEEAINPIGPGLDLIPSRLANSALDNILTLEHHPLDRVLKDRLDPLREKYDLILIDCPPALSASVAAATLASDLVICPIAPEKYCLDGLKMTCDELHNLERKFRKKIPFRVLLNKFDSRTYLSAEILEQLHSSKNFGEKLYKTFIRLSQEIPNTTAKRLSIFDALRSSPAQEDFDAITREILNLNAQRPKIMETSIPFGSLESSASNFTSLTQVST